MLDADSRLIEWLLHDSGISRYKISKELGVAESTLSRIAKGQTPMEAVKFGLAHKLTQHARDIQLSNERENPESEEIQSQENEPEGGDGHE